MKITFFLALLFLLVGIGATYVSQGLVEIEPFTAKQNTAAAAATAIFILAASVSLGIGIALISHLLARFIFGNFLGFGAEIILSIAFFFGGIGAAIMSKNFWIGIEIAVAGICAGMMLLALSPITVAGGIKKEALKSLKWIRKRTK